MQRAIHAWIPRAVLVALVLAVAQAEGAENVSASSATSAIPAVVVWPLRVFGALLVIYGLFAVPGDQRRYESYLVRWWVWVEERRETGLKWQTAFLHVLASVMTSGFARVFGHRVLSLRAALASISLSIAVLVCIAIYLVLTEPVRDVELDRYFHIVLGLYIVLALLPLLIVARGQTKAMFVYNALIIGSWFIFVHEGTTDLLFILALSLASDVLFVAATRWLLAFSTSLGSATTIVALILLNGAAAAALIVMPVIASKTGGIRWHDVMVLAAGCNLFDGFVAVSTIALGAVMLVHRAIWPFIGRPLEVISSEHVLLKRWPLFFTGVSVLGVSWAPFGAFLGWFHR